MIEFFSPGKNHLNDFKENALSMVTFFLIIGPLCTL